LVPVLGGDPEGRRKRGGWTYDHKREPNRRRISMDAQGDRDLLSLASAKKGPKTGF